MSKRSRILLSPEEHKSAHKTLHTSFDLLFADYIYHHPNQVEFSSMPLGQLMEWSYQQTQKPTE